jgi:hypothetical protein
MSTLRFAIIGLLVVGANVFGWRAARTRLHWPTSPPSAQPPASEPVSQQPQNSGPQGRSATAPPGESANHLGPFSIAGRNYSVELQTKKVGPGPTDEQYDTVVAMEIRDTTGAVQYRRTFPYMEAKEDDFESWSVSARLLTGTNGTGLLVSYGVYSEPSAPEEEPTGWFQIFGVLDGRFVPFGATLEVQGGLLDEYADGHTYKAARPLGTQADAVEFKTWTGHCRLIYPVRVDWTQGKLTPAQECAKTAGELGAGCQYKVVPEDKLYTEGITFVRLWAGPDEQSGQPMKAVVKKDSKVDLLTALVATQWTESSAAGSSANSKGPMDDAGGFGVVADTDLWLKVRIDGKEGWMHSEEDFRALGLPEDE